ncbi:B12-binding domain-containing radical SAM protein [Chloroflexota bacterium]
MVPKSRGVGVQQEDWSIEFACRLFSKNGLELLSNYVHAVQRKRLTAPTKHFLDEFHCYRDTIEPIVAYLQNPHPDTNARISSRGWLPEGKRLRTFLDYQAIQGEKPFGNLDVHDEASYIASLYLWDLVDIIHEIEPEFELTSYARFIAATSKFDNVINFLRKHRKGLISRIIEEIASERLSKLQPDVLGLTVPFCGSLVGALRIAETARRHYPKIKIVMGGSYPNTYLRDITDPRLFDYVDFLTLDDGERPLECILRYLAEDYDSSRLLRTFIRKKKKVIYCSSTEERDIPFDQSTTPSYAGLPLESYIALRSASTRADQIWSRKWNKLTLAHGCYWHQCSFCDISLDYVQRFEPQKVERLIEHINTIIAETGQTGFHWVDEAIPPSLLRKLCEQLIDRNIVITWWGNIRFEQAFTPELAQLMAKAGCMAVTGGLEVASDRLLKVMNKGVSIEQVTRVSKAFADQGIFVHVYLMYGFPGETVQETVDSLEIVRQLFAEKCIHSGFWHRFEVSKYSPIGMYPEQFGIKLHHQYQFRYNRMFGRFSIPFKDPTKIDHAILGEGLSKAIGRYQHGLDLDRPVNEWFPQSVPSATIASDMIARSLSVMS